MAFRLSTLNIGRLVTASVVTIGRIRRIDFRARLKMALDVTTSNMQPRRSMADGGHPTKQADDKWPDERSHRRLSGRERVIVNAVRPRTFRTYTMGACDGFVKRQKDF